MTGPTGSGKSTTLAAMIDQINRTRSQHIVTIEDPIEFLHHDKKCIVTQREVGTDTHSFADALQHVLRQDPDVILVGEMRDLETIQLALTAAETGHLVFATLHTHGAAQTIDRIIDVFPPHQQAQVRVQLSTTLMGGLHAAAAADARRPRPRRGLRDHGGHAGRPAPHPRAQDVPDPERHPDGRPVRHADHGRRAGRPGPRGKITRELALTRCSSPDTFERLLEQSA